MINVSGEPIHFLLVDDLEENLLALDALLRREGRILLKASSGYEALELLLKHEVALALVDVQMPGMDGFELAELMRGTERTRTVPIIFLTAGIADRQRRFRGYEAGAVDFLLKPIEADILSSKVGVFSELYRQRREVTRQRDELKIATEEITRLLDESRSYAAALKEADLRKDEFLATLAHELRNPLSPISSAITVMKDCADDPQEVQKLTEIADRQVKLLVRLVNDLLDISRIRLGKIELQKSLCSLQQVIEQAIESSWHLIQELQHTLSFDVPSTPILVNGDPVRLTQIVTNLLNNAAKYSPPGGRIQILVTSEGNVATIKIADHGYGMPPDRIADVFELFTQLEPQNVSDHSGLGIGLALVKQLVDLHEGTIEIESEGYNQGTQVFVRLPICETTTEQHVQEIRPAVSPKNRTAMKSRRVLVVDDLRAITITLSRLLERMGHHVQSANDGHAAMELIGTFHPEVVISDVSMPGMNGYELAAAIRDRHGDSIRLVAMTGYGLEADRERAVESGFDHHMVKPPDVRSLEQLFNSFAPPS